MQNQSGIFGDMLGISVASVDICPVVICVTSFSAENIASSIKKTETAEKEILSSLP